jgi:ABC-type amino acid transport substrate-binding protein
MDIKLDVVPYARCKKSLEDGAVAACFSMSAAPDIPKSVVFSDQPLFEVYADLFRNAKAAGHETRLDELPKGAVIGIVNGYEYPDAIAGLARRGVVLERGINEWANLQMLARGRLDGALVMTSEFSNGARRLSEAGVADSVSYAFRSGVMKSYIGFSLSNPQGARALQAFNTGYRIIIQNHTKDRIRDKWMQSVRP